MADSFNRLDQVDAWHNDGWWVGVISRVQNNSRYIVYFRESDEEFEFEQSELRLHQDWIDGKWMAAFRLKYEHVKFCDSMDFYIPKSSL
ncbi:hypothetical protein Q3G72_031950 [Acer saccharum]|nr:hypothetical protein Q3G72_031950 [Acer saccharum]